MRPVLSRNKKGIYFISIDETRPLSEQGPFDIILHKLASKEWQQVLEVRDVWTPWQRIIMKDLSSIPDAVAKAGLTD
ncbi:hypothetical protein ACP4OV_003884 [Aristida adscensionis]